MLKKILIGLAALVLIFVIVVALQPSDFQMQRSTTIAAPQADIFAQVNDFRKWEAWSPWAKLDPQAKVSFEGPAEGVGTVMTWSGTNEVGEGKMTLTESRPYELIETRVEMVKPMKGSSTSERRSSSNCCSPSPREATKSRRPSRASRRSVTLSAGRGGCDGTTMAVCPKIL